MRWMGIVVLLSGCVASPCTGELVALDADGCGVGVRELDPARGCLLPLQLLRVPSGLAEELVCTAEEDTGRLFQAAYPVVYGRPGAEGFRACTDTEHLAVFGALACP